MKKLFLLSLIMTGLFLTLFNPCSAQDDDENTRYVGVDKTNPDAVILEKPDRFSDPICGTDYLDTVTLLDSIKGAYTKVRYKCKGKYVEGWVKKSILTKEIKSVDAKASLAEGASGSAQAVKGSIGYEPIDTTGMRSKIVVVSAAKGTGRTTGHIADIMVTNNSDQSIPIAHQSFYIPSSGRYQGYVGRINPGQQIPPGSTVPIPVMGYCTDVRKPPVPIGANMPDIDTWISVRSPDLPPDSPPSGITLIPGRETLPFTSDDIPAISALPGFKDGSGSDIPLTWPGTNIPFNGVLDLDKNTVGFASLLVDAVMRIEHAAYNMVSKDLVETPFSGADKREAEALTQQTVWITVAGYVGEPYEKNEFKDQLVKQYENNTGTNFNAATDEVKEEINNGVDQFWSSFSAVGMEAKVFSADQMSDADLSGVKAHTGGTAKDAADKAGTDASATGGVYVNPGADDLVKDEVAHSNQGINSAVDYDDVKTKKDYDKIDDGGQGKKKYDQYAKARLEMGKSHEEALNQAGIKAGSSLAKSVKKVFKNEKQ